ncbi:Bacterial low temperature requirement A protein (LtrA) [Micromonospora sp. MW-13]|uniref:low temperature requirement protein A n=1 Tax=Micromonospora sp. MW-13 TaxID=2094022 RepID=UPI000EEAC454|nr:low temperature requirement protein A [Micromonospora sp. MW-13]RGC65399.1 Bacterial low temperature requirement A protein (LtrA) [Micromonospora sp. MW-13]
MRATFLELFFDVIYVFAFTRITSRSVEVLAGPSADFVDSAAANVAKGVFVLLTLWFLWHLTVWTTSRYDPNYPMVQAVIVLALVSSMVMGVAVPGAFGSRGLAFAIAYVVAQTGRVLILIIGDRAPERRQLKLRVLITFGATGILWIVGAALEGGWRGTLWGLALGVELVMARAGWPIPGLGRSDVKAITIAGEHLADRYQQLFFVALGEMALSMGRSYSEGDIDPSHTIAFAVSLAISILMWRIYVYRAGQVLLDTVSMSVRPGSVVWKTADSHLVMVAGVVTTAIGQDLVIDHPFDSNHLSWTILILGGPAVFTLGRARFEYEVFSRVSPSRFAALAVLAMLVPVMVHLPPLAALLSAAVVLAASAIVDARRSAGKPPESPFPPPERLST